MLKLSKCYFHTARMAEIVGMWSVCLLVPKKKQMLIMNFVHGFYLAQYVWLLDLKTMVAVVA